ncbi:two-component system, OmpR family, sensor histidine kinase BaeS [Micromonospora rhizosphaerae]|uniref:histidine kinase n=1 Tax=Micromonospora rhizosphaerae TaxID=568872 RepID=A0A1C6T1G3_9ACTN|nr:ATP-binding protein [Micromonospora rhizosphaerae]SCL35422.1 two-component system, OmpR family, sensor histidine kinase BaeS [Micromonospora rhizosphaerae]
MSFRLRVLWLVILVAVSATAATAWLTLRQASQQINDSATTDRAQLDQVVGRLRTYSSQHGTWEGVPDLVQDLRTQTGQRIHLVADTGDVIVDTDTQENRTARPLGTMVGFVDPRPVLNLAALPAEPAGREKGVVVAINAYRTGVLFAACLTRESVPVVASTTSTGVPQFDADLGAADGRGRRGVDEIVDGCRDAAAEPGRDRAAGAARVQVCGTSTEEPVDSCLARAFTNEISDVAPVPARVYLGARGDPASVLTAGPLLAAAVGVAAVAVIGTALLSRRVLRPIDTLTAAAQRLGRGDLTGRVPVRGNDELAELARSFNRMADSLQRGEERQRRLVADVAHELRTPLANLRGYLEALSDGVITPDQDLFASLHEEAVLQQRIVDDLQDLALAEAGNLAYHRVTVDLAELLETCRTAHHARAESAGVSLRVAAEPVAVHADPDRLRQVVGNLVTNALRATAAGGSVRLVASRTETQAIVQVVDTGSGIATDALPHVFDRFWRADAARGRRTGGSGLGLAIARQIVTDHQGTIRVASEVGVGTTFTITLPRAD